MKSGDRLIKSPIHTVFRIRIYDMKHHITNKEVDKEMKVVTHKI